MAETRTIRTTINPDVEIEVGPAEYTDLRRSGLIFTPPPVDDAAASDAEQGDQPATDAAPERLPYHAEKSGTARKAPRPTAPADTEQKES